MIQSQVIQQACRNGFSLDLLAQVLAPDGNRLKPRPGLGTSDASLAEKCDTQSQVQVDNFDLLLGVDDGVQENQLP